MSVGETALLYYIDLREVGFEVRELYGLERRWPPNRTVSEQLKVLSSPGFWRIALQNGEQFPSVVHVLQRLVVKQKSKVKSAQAVMEPFTNIFVK